MNIIVDLNVNAPELVDAIRALAASLSGSGLALSKAVGQGQQQPMAPQQHMPATVLQFPQPQPQQPLAPVATPQPPAPAGVPTSAQAYTMEQLAVAATSLIDQGHREKVVQLLAQFGVPSLMQLPKEQYGGFATQLRGMGAK